MYQTRLETVVERTVEDDEITDGWSDEDESGKQRRV